ncbi:MAG: aspartate/glutamate racemase family protein [Bacteroidetes bacterium]|nr:aspartate/glutamate racemase family protein [Bacteroidota bacterium]
MKTLGLIGGTGYISTVEYYRLINEGVNKKLGGLEFARCVLYSLNYGDISALNRQNDIPKIYELVLDAVNKLILAGAQGLILCANTLHRFADDIETQINVPLIHIATATAAHIRQQQLTKIGLLGTRQTMELDFYTSRLKEHGINTIIPERDDRDFIQDAIENELLKGIFLDKTKARFIRIMNILKDQGAQGIILGCTEIPLIISQKDTDLPVFDTLKIHAQAAVDFAIENKQ